jgi:hypothetical protein
MDIFCNTGNFTIKYDLWDLLFTKIIANVLETGTRGLFCMPELTAIVAFTEIVLSSEIVMGIRVVCILEAS